MPFQVNYLHDRAVNILSNSFSATEFQFELYLITLLLFPKCSTSRKMPPEYMLVPRFLFNLTASDKLFYKETLSG